MSSLALPLWIQTLVQQATTRANIPNQEVGEDEHELGIVPEEARPFFLATIPLHTQLDQLTKEYLKAKDMEGLLKVDQETILIQRKIACLNALFMVEIYPLVRAHPKPFLSFLEIRKGWVLVVVPNKNAGKILARAFEKAQQEEYGL